MARQNKLGIGKLTKGDLTTVPNTHKHFHPPTEKEAWRLL